MIVDSSNKLWIWTAVTASAVGGLLYIPYALGSPVKPSGGSWPGILYAIAGTGMMTFAGILGARKKYPTLRVGRVQTWMRGHVWLSLLSVPMILFHSGFAMGGTLTSLLVVMFALVTISGIAGLILQQFVPRLMMEQVASEVVYDQAEEYVNQLLESAEKSVQSLQPGDQYTTANEFYAKQVKPFIAGAGRDGLLSTKHRADAAFRHMRVLVPPAAHSALNELLELVEKRRDLTRQLHLHRLLHGWLLVHVPISAALFTLIVVHALMAVRYA